MTTASIKLDRISLSVPLYVQPERRTRGWASMLLGAALDPPRRVHAKLLEEISFEAGDGDRVAILGRNGAGKSTLLRVLNGVYPPSGGRMEVNGTRQALLNLSLGFNSEATVRENIFLRGTAMRLRAANLRDKVESILEFAGLQEKANHRLRTLSTGQKMRLGFAISTSVKHDIILMDEWVGAGDSAFMARATERMKSHMGGSKIVMLASHSVGLLRDVCNKGIVLEQGRLVHAGDILSALQHYHELMASVPAGDNEPDAMATQLVYGCAETIRMEGGVIRISGWIASTDGSSPRGLALETGGVRYEAIELARGKRPDVKRHFGLANADCGFSASFRVENVKAIPELAHPVRVLGGMAPEHAGTALRVAPALSAALRGTS